MSSKNLFSVLADTQSEDPKALSAKLEKTQTSAPAPQQQQQKPQQKPVTKAAQQNAEAFESTGKEQRAPRSSGGRGKYPRRGGKPQDRHVSRNMRGRGIKKQGAGGYNWGAPGSESTGTEEGQQQQQQEKTTEQAQTPVTPTGEEQPAQPAEPVDNTQSYEEFLKQQEERKKKLAVEGLKPSARKAGEGISVDQKIMKKGEKLEDNNNMYLQITKKEEKKEATTTKKEEKKTAEKKPAEKTVHITEFLEGVEVPPRQREFSGERRGRGRGRGRGGRGGRGGQRGGRGASRGAPRGTFQKKPDFDLADTSAFPTLGPK